ncbi:dipeptidyl peptidase III [Chaetomium sp. MPI-SDFR-AT-0129]|nr:dipeptidyl peptidase III [Chaetomium sp. MPI-SDFR-AT-0129]
MAANNQKPVIHQLAIKPLFDSLTAREKLYAHHLSKAAWGGGKILMRQVSPEGPAIANFILSLYRACQGQWKQLADRTGVSAQELDGMLDYSAQFFCNMGNFYGSGDQKFIPAISKDSLRKLASPSSKTTALLDEIIEPMFSIPPYSIGYPSNRTQSGYYLGDKVTKEELSKVTKVLEGHSTEPQNTRLHKHWQGSEAVYDILQASTEMDNSPRDLQAPGLDAKVRLVRGDHHQEMLSIVSALEEAAKYAFNDKQAGFIRHLIESFQTGSLDAYREALKAWITDASPRVETILGFVEPIRDPQGVRAEWEGVVAIYDSHESGKLKKLAQNSTKFVRILPWAVDGVNGGKGPFEPERFEAPDFAIVHALTFCSSCIWDAVNLPNYLDIRQTLGCKNLMFANRMATYNSPSHTRPFIDPSEWEGFKNAFGLVRFVMNAIHELLGHGTGKLLAETSPGEYNFDKQNPPINSLTGKPVDSWYRLARLGRALGDANLVAYYLADDKELLALFGYDDHSTSTADDFMYYTYLFIAVEGVLGLQFYEKDGQSWGQPHRRAAFAILKHLLLDAADLITIHHNLAEKTLRIHINRAKILSHGKPSLGRLLTKIHIWRCTADIPSCEALYEPLSTVDGIYEEWRQIVVAHPEPQAMFVQANTFLDKDGRVEVKVYEESREGIIQSFAERWG